MGCYSKLYRNIAGLAYRAGILALLLAISGHFVSACSLEDRKESTVRAHDDNIQGVSHAFTSKSGPRYCKQCHGTALQGGGNGEPSCFQCHGENWDPIDADTPRGDADHTVDNGGFLHHSGIASPTTNCTACHGANLQGDLQKTGNPSCFLCHEQKW